MSNFEGTLLSRVTEVDMRRFGSLTIPILDTWIYFNLVANTFLLPILISTFILSKRAKRHPTLINVCMTWVLSGIFSLLLFYTDQHLPGTPEPNKNLCIAQTSLLFGITPMWSVAILMLVWHLNMVFSRWNPRPVVSKLVLVFMLCAPYLTQIGFSVATLISALQQPNRVTRAHGFFYCALSNRILFQTMTLFTFAICVVIIVLEVRLAFVLYRNWKASREAGKKSYLDLQLLIRVLIFGVYVFFGIIVVVISYFDSRSIAPDMYAATMGAVLFLVFGTQPDVLRSWCFWMRPKEKPAPVIDLSRSSNIQYQIDLEKSGPPIPTEKFILPEQPSAVLTKEEML